MLIKVIDEKQRQRKQSEQSNQSVVEVQIAGCSPSDNLGNPAKSLAQWKMPRPKLESTS